MQKVAFVTGGARRIGAEIVRILHESGMNVVIHFNQSQQAAMELCDHLNTKRKNSAAILAADLADIKNIPLLIESAFAKWNRLDVLVNNASLFYKTKITETTEAQWDDLMNTNLKSPYFLSQTAAPFLAKENGCIINIADIHSERALRDYPVYSISKAGLIMMTKSLARELGPSIRVNAISPGPVLWPEAANSLSADQKSELIDRTALKKEGTPEQIAKAVLFLANNADYVTGQVITVDGGRNLFI